MNKYVLTLFSFGAPMPQPFEAPADPDAVWWAKGFIAGFTGRNEEEYVGSKWQLDADAGTGTFDDAALVGACVMEKRDGIVGQQWRVVRRRWLRSGSDMNVGDPHDDPAP